MDSGASHDEYLWTLNGVCFRRFAGGFNGDFDVGEVESAGRE